jgi:predicted phage-related endonuclease
MTDRQIRNRLQKLQDLEQQIKDLEAKADDLRTEIKITMEDRETDEIKVTGFTVRWKEIISRRLDGTALKKALPDVWQTYSKETLSKRFTVTAA